MCSVSTGFLVLFISSMGQICSPEQGTLLWWEKKKANLEGKQESLLEKLKTEFQINNIEEIDNEIEKDKLKLEKLEIEINDNLLELEKYDME